MSRCNSMSNMKIVCDRVNPGASFLSPGVTVSAYENNESDETYLSMNH